MSRYLFAIVAVPTVLSGALFTVTAGAAELSTEVSPGVTLTQHDGDGQEWYAVRIQRGAGDIRLSGEANRGRTVSEIAERESADIAVNGAIFYADYGLCGVGVSRGTLWSRVKDTKCAHAFGLSASADVVEFFDGTGLGKGPFPIGVTEASGGYPYLVRRGTACDGSSPSVCSIPATAPRDFQAANPRTMVGTDRSRSQLIFVVVDGRRAGKAAGMSLVEAARFMRSTIGAYDAVNLDGGGSSTLYIRSLGGVVNKPSDGEERRVADALVVRIVARDDAGSSDARSPADVADARDFVPGPEAGTSDAYARDATVPDSDVDAREVSRPGATRPEAATCAKGHTFGRLDGSAIALVASVCALGLRRRRSVRNEDRR